MAKATELREPKHRCTLCGHVAASEHALHKHYKAHREGKVKEEARGGDVRH